MKRRLIVLAAGVAFTGFGLTLWSALNRAAPSAAGQGSMTMPRVPVSVGLVTVKDVPVFLDGIGTVQAFNTITIKSRVDGQIIGVRFTEGQEVKAGAPLFQIDPRPFEANLAQARAARKKDEAQLESAQLDLDRASSLIAKGVRTQQSYDQQKALVAQLKAAIDGDQAQIDTAELNLGFATIRAPISGRLGARLVDIGNLVHASDSTALVRITQVRPIFVSFTLPQETIDDIRQQQVKAPLVVEGLSSDNRRRLARGKLTLIDNSVDAATGTIRLKAQFDNKDEQLWPGEFVNVRVILDMRRSVPTVPSPAVQEGPDGYFVYVVGPDRTVHRKPIQVAAIQDGIAAVTDGLSAGEQVVVNGQFRLTDGVHVSVDAPSATADRGRSR